MLGKCLNLTVTETNLQIFKDLKNSPHLRFLQKLSKVFNHSEELGRGCVSAITHLNL